MKIQRMIRTTLTIAGLIAASTIKADEVTDWNAIMQTTVAAGNANVQARSGAIVQLAVFEAVNSIVGDYEPYLEIITTPAGASPNAAAIAAAYTALAALYPASNAVLSASQTVSLAQLPDGPDKDAGIEVGQAAALAMLALRLNDGAAGAQGVPYTPGTNPGDWQPAPPTFTVASQPGWGLVMPFGLDSGSQFRLPPPPPIDSGRYALDYNEIKLVGNINAGPDIRPQDRTDVARFFSVSSPVQAWNQAARQVSAAQGKTLSENARIFALVAMAICDASIATYETKYFYNTWRPTMAIRGGDLDGNHKTEPDAGWFPLITTPAFPSYPSAHATLSAAARTVLERVFGKHNLAITLTSPRAPGIVLNYTQWKQICNDIDDARIYGGIHFRFEQEAGGHQGQDVGHYILDNHLRPRE
ncbi:MAG TPA: vanadium-dependent haloperoxidase [Verrucomicrobiae bacterium]|nr:vanadium-dependent haloperoxidase [Verrucomicrobiae bacterium]